MSRKDPRMNPDNYVYSITGKKPECYSALNEIKTCLLSYGKPWFNDLIVRYGFVYKDDFILETSAEAAQSKEPISAGISAASHPLSQDVSAVALESPAQKERKKRPKSKRRQRLQAAKSDAAPVANADGFQDMRNCFGDKFGASNIFLHYEQTVTSRVHPRFLGQPLVFFNAVSRPVDLSSAYALDQSSYDVAAALFAMHRGRRTHATVQEADDENGLSDDDQPGLCP